MAFNDVNGIQGTDLLSLYQQEIMSQGILSIGINNYCLAHTSEDLDKYILAVDKALNRVALAVENGDIDSFLKGGRIRPIFKRS